MLFCGGDAGGGAGGGVCGRGGGAMVGAGEGADPDMYWGALACVAASGRCPPCTVCVGMGERFCVDDSRVPLTEKRESRSESARNAACATVGSAFAVCDWICVRMPSSRRSSASLASEEMASSRMSFSSRLSSGSTASITL